MDKKEYLILRYVVTGMEPVGALTAKEDNFYDWFNAPYHGLSAAELAAVLHRLFEAGDITAEWRSKDEPPFVPSQIEIERALKAGDIFDEELFDYGLTATGGQRWETVAKPDWSRYLLAWTDLDKIGEVVALDYSRVKQYFDSQEVQILAAEWDVLSPWQATYWKQLPRGYRVRYQYDDATEEMLEANLHKRWGLGAEWWTWFTDPN